MDSSKGTSHNIPQHCATQYAQQEKQAKEPLHNLVEKIQATGFYPAIKDKPKKGRKEELRYLQFIRKGTQKWVLYKSLLIFCTLKVNHKRIAKRLKG